MTRRAAALLLACACALVPEQPRPGPDEGEWAAARDRHTRAAKLYDGLATRAFATATWDAPAVRAARVERIATWKAMTVEERAALAASEAEAAASWDEFTIALFTPDRAENDLDSSSTAWRVALVAGGGERLPVEVRSVRRDATLRTLYPYVGDFDVVYRLRFRKLEGAAAAPTLRLAGPRGILDLQF